MSLDLALRIEWNAKEWLKPGTLFVVRKNFWVDPVYGFGDLPLRLAKNDVVLFLEAKIEKAERRHINGSEICCRYRLLIGEVIYCFCVSTLLSSNYNNFDEEDIKITKNLFYDRISEYFFF